jgi:hypothetical protein
VEHSLDDVVHGALVVPLDHELWGVCELLLRAGTRARGDRGETVLVNVGHEETIHGSPRVLRHWVAMRIAAQCAAVCAPSQAGKHAVEFARAQLLPVDAVLGNDTIAGDFSEHHAEGEDIGRLVELAAQSLGCEIVAVTFAVDVLRRRPLASEAKVGNLKTTLKVNEDVGRLQVEVDVARVMDECQALQFC